MSYLFCENCKETINKNDSEDHYVINCMICDKNICNMECELCLCSECDDCITDICYECYTNNDELCINCIRN